MSILSGMTDLASRHDKVSFVDYLRSGPQFFVQAARAKEFPDMLALCGKSVGTSRRTSFPGEIAEWSDAHCKPAGKPAINVVGTEGSPDARTQLKQARVDAAMQGNETLPYVMKLEPDTYATVGERIRASSPVSASPRTRPNCSKRSPTRCGRSSRTGATRRSSTNGASPPTRWTR